MKTITEANMKRLIVQRDEAKTVGLNKIASQLSAQIGTVGVRGDSDDYHYSKEELRNEIESSLWDVAIRAQDFYGKFADARVVQDIIEKQADEFIDSIKTSLGAEVGAYEATLPGEVKPTIEVTEDD